MFFVHDAESNTKSHNKFKVAYMACHLVGPNTRAISLVKTCEYLVEISFA